MRKHEYEGIFEVHITVANDSSENEERFKGLCEVHFPFLLVLGLSLLMQLL